MEDNEFEEVTIISHTDRPHRVFSEKSIEKLKEQISLEIVKEISGTEDKTYSDDPRLAPGLRELEKLKQDHLGEGEGKICAKDQREIGFISRVAGESGQYILGAGATVLFAAGEHSKLQTVSFRVRFVVFWGDHVVVAMLVHHTHVLDRNFELVKKLECRNRVEFCRHVQTTPQNLYIRGDSNGGGGQTKPIIRLDKNLKEDLILLPGKSCEDFFVCPKTETITTLNKEKEDTWNIRRDDKTVPLIPASTD